jgi:DNA-binding response OmpR family regulator
VRTPRKTVLVVDDDKDIVELLCAFIDTDDVQAIGVTDAEEGLRLARTLPLVLVLCDWTMPLMSGGEFVTRLRAHAEMDGLPVAIMSGHPLRDLEEMGAQAFLPKPFTLPEVLTLIESFVQETVSKPRFTRIPQATS